VLGPDHGRIDALVTPGLHALVAFAAGAIVA